MEQKFQRGFRVLILSRLSVGANENYGIGEEAIIQYSSIERPDDFLTNCCLHDGKTYYAILILFPDNTEIMQWYEEQFLELICCNAAKGEKILKENYIT